jgi:PadR family transcriptional regulator PadR
MELPGGQCAPAIEQPRRTRYWPSLSDLGNISVVPDQMRVTGPLLDVSEAFLRAFDDDAELYGWAILKATKRSGPTIYGVLDRLEDAGWITGRWEIEHPEPNKPRRRLYRLTPTGVVAARELLAERRPKALRPSRRVARGLACMTGLRALLTGSGR